MRCSEVPEVEAPAPPASSGATQGGGSSGGSSSGGSSSSGDGSGGSSSSGDAAAPANAAQGCYFIQNQLGAELTVTLTRVDSGTGNTFKVAGGAEVEKCLDPGKYTYTIDAPPPWDTVNGDLNVQAGDAFLWPVTGE